MNFENNIHLESTAIYSSWCYHKPSRILFDCGENCASSFRNEIYGVENIFISHSHADHVLGLPSFIGIRNSVRGDKNKGLNVYYPKNDFRMINLIDFINKMYNRLSYELKFIPIEAGFTMDISKDSYLKSFSMNHQKNATTLGYKIVEKRNRLKPEFVGKDIPSLIKSGVPKNSLSESYEANEFAYCLDSSGFNYEEIRDCRLVIMDTTFLKTEDRDDLTHFSLSEVISICTKMNVKEIICAHISPRYNLSEVKESFKNVPNNFKYHINN